MEEPGSANRFWICEFALNSNGGKPQFAVRLSFRQPHNSTTGRPEPRAPRFLRKIVESIGAFDVAKMEASCLLVDRENFDSFMELVQSPKRSLPVVAISEDMRFGDVCADPDKLAQILAGTAHVMRLTPESSWQLTREWGSDWSTFQGAIRCYNPNFDLTGDRFKHRLWLPQAIQKLDSSFRNGFLNACAGHVFTQVTAQFESWPLLTPATVRRFIEDAESSAAVSPKVATILSAAPAVSPEKPKTPRITGGDVEAKSAAAQLAESAANEIKMQVADLTAKLKRQEDNSRALEQALQQERAGRAEEERAHQETKVNLEIHQETVATLQERNSISTGDISLESSEALKPLWQNFSGFFNAMQNVASQFRRMERDSAINAELESQLDDAKDQIRNLTATLESINRKSVPDIQSVAESLLQRSDFIEILPRLAQKNPSLETSLKAVSFFFPERITILKSAYESAEESSVFKHGEQGFDLIWLLATKYWESIQNGNGDSEAKNVFGKSYSPRESVRLSKAGQDRRTFEYGDASLLMNKHLKIGTADNAADTLRIHFEWLAAEKRVVVGYCGKHLDF